MSPDDCRYGIMRVAPGAPGSKELKRAYRALSLPCTWVMVTFISLLLYCTVFGLSRKRSVRLSDETAKNARHGSRLLPGCCWFGEVRSVDE